MCRWEMLQMGGGHTSKADYTSLFHTDVEGTNDTKQRVTLIHKKTDTKPSWQT